MFVKLYRLTVLFIRYKKINLYTSVLLKKSFEHETIYVPITIYDNTAVGARFFFMYLLYQSRI